MLTGPRWVRGFRLWSPHVPFSFVWRKRIGGSNQTAFGTFNVQFWQAFLKDRHDEGGAENPKWILINRRGSKFTMKIDFKRQMQSSGECLCWGLLWRSWWSDFIPYHPTIKMRSRKKWVLCLRLKSCTTWFFDVEALGVWWVFTLLSSPDCTMRIMIVFSELFPCARQCVRSTSQPQK